MSRRFVVTFGKKRSDAAGLQRLAASQAGKAPPGARVFEAGSTPAFRLGSDDGVRYPPALLADVPGTAQKLAWLKAAAARDLDVFAKHPRRLLDLYFEWITARLGEDAAALEQLLRPLGGLFRVGDWAFAALRPLPNAAVFDADAPEPASPVLLHDIAFWTGDAVLTIRLRGSSTPLPHDAEARDRLLALGVRIVTVPVQDLAAGIGIFSEPRFPREFVCFWQGEAYPCSPFRPRGLPRSLALG
jgi:hypothetical protein